MLRIFCLSSIVFITCLVSAQEPRALDDFDGTKHTIPGLFDEPLPLEFYEMNLVEIFQQRRNYGGYFTVPEDWAGQSPALVYLINEFDTENAVVLSAVSLGENKTKNFLIQIPAFEVMEVDVAQLAEYDLVLFLSLAPFQVQLNRTVLQQGNPVTQLEIEPPIATEEMSRADCYGMTDVFQARITSVPQGGSVIAKIRLGYNVAGLRLFLDVYYPFDGPIFHLNDAPYPPCSPTSGTPPDRYYTTSLVTGRYLKWTGIRAESSGSLFARGRASCEAPDTGPNDCILNDGTRDNWRVKKIN